jgi:hypothetical protein
VEVLALPLVLRMDLMVVILFLAPLHQMAVVVVERRAVHLAVLGFLVDLAEGVLEVRVRNELAAQEIPRRQPQVKVTTAEETLAQQ